MKEKETEIAVQRKNFEQRIRKNFMEEQFYIQTALVAVQFLF